MIPASKLVVKSDQIKSTTIIFLHIAPVILLDEKQFWKPQRCASSKLSPTNPIIKVSQSS